MKVPVIIALLATNLLASANYTESQENDQDVEGGFLILDAEEEILAEEEEDEEHGLVVPEGPEDCSRYSPQEMFFLETQPRLIKSIDELNVYIETILFKTEEALRILIPIMPDSPLGTIELDNLFLEMRSFMLERLNVVFEDIQRSWHGLFYTHTALRAPVAQQLEAAMRVEESIKVGERTLIGVTNEIMQNIRAIVVNSIHSIRATVDDSKGITEYTGADAVYKKLPEVAPNFLGKLMSKILSKGTDKTAYKTMDLNIFKPMLEPITQLVTDLESLATVVNNGSTSTLEDIWLVTINSCHERLVKEPLIDEDYEALFANEEYLAELTLSLMATF